MNTKCEHWYGTWHNFGKWTVKGEYDITRSFDDAVTGHAICQERACTLCGYVEQKIDTKSIRY